jgi:Fe-S-cluster-containing dehydrogenase component
MAIGTEERVVVFDADKCSGCRICELVCSMRHHGEYNPKKSLIRIMANEEAGVYVPILDIQCHFCGECVEACPLEALSISELGEAVIARKNATIGSFPIPLSSMTGT